MRWAHNDVGKWHNWFAWYPVLLDGVEEWVWFETIERKLVESTVWDGSWSYRNKQCSTTDTQ